jgi:hypothetical protein
VTAGLLLVLTAAAAVIAWIVVGPVLAARRRRAALRSGRRSPTPSAPSLVAARAAVPTACRPGWPQRLDGLIGVFVAEKDFIGCDGTRGHRRR